MRWDEDVVKAAVQAAAVVAVVVAAPTPLGQAGAVCVHGAGTRSSTWSASRAFRKSARNAGNR